MDDNNLKQFILQTLGFKNNLDFDDLEDELVKKINFIYENLIQKVLSRHRWRFAINRVELIEKIELIDQKYNYSYTLPTDYVIFIGIFGAMADQHNRKEFQITNKLLTDYDVVFLEYVARVETSVFPTYFIEYLRYKLAFEMCFDLTGDTDLMNILKQKATEEFIIAKNIESRQYPSERINTNSFIDVRFS